MTVCKWLFKMSEYQNNRVSNLHISIYVYRIVHLENTNDQLHRKNIEPLCFPPRNYIYCEGLHNMAISISVKLFMSPHLGVYF